MNARLEKFILWVLHIPFILILILATDGLFYAYILLNNLMFGTELPQVWVYWGMFVLSAVTGTEFVLAIMCDKLRTGNNRKKIHKLDDAFLNN